MKPVTIITAIAILSLPFGESRRGVAQTPGEWTWMHGDNTPGSPGVFGIQGVPSPANKPPGLYEPCEWKDNNGNFWLFGGAKASVNGYFSALWKYDPFINQWTWMNGSPGQNQPGFYGTQGVPSSANYPGARGLGATTWVDTSGNLWLFGGLGFTTIGFGSLNDLWKYNISTNEWTWIKGTNTNNSAGSYGTQGVTSTTNLPPARAETSCSWTDISSNLWLFGGRDFTGSGNVGDLWKYDISSNEWTWIHGANILNPSAVYGVQGVAAPANMPGGRWAYCSWSDLVGDLWLFGGADGSGRHNDLWKYNIASNQWTWMKGPNTGNNWGNYGVKCVSTNNNIPSARIENRARVRDACGNFWNIGGGGYGDLWHYKVSTNQWTWVSGDNISNQAAVYGIQNVSSPTNKIGGRAGNVAWIDNKGYIWVFGGLQNTFDYYNDLFRYVPDSACVPCDSLEPSSINEISLKNWANIFPNPNNGVFTIQVGMEKCQVSIYNVLGEKIYSSKINSKKTVIDLSKQPKGIYVYKVSDGKEETSETIATGKIIIE